MQKAIKSYLGALESGSLEKLISLFTENAIIYSPLYGKMQAAEFYKVLFRDTRNSEITLFDIFINKKRKKASCHFRYQWTLGSGEKTAFECVDIFEFDDNGKIARLKIIYDTAKTRAVWNATKNADG